MKKAATRNRNSDKKQSDLVHQLLLRAREGILICGVALAIYFFSALITYHTADPGWSLISTGAAVIHNSGGPIGAWLADVFLYLLGYAAYLIPPLIAYAGWCCYRQRFQKYKEDYLALSLRILGYLLLFSSASGLCELYGWAKTVALPYTMGGVLGHVLVPALLKIFSFYGTALVLIAVFLSAITLALGVSWLKILDVSGNFTYRALLWIGARARDLARLFQRLKPLTPRETAPRTEPSVAATASPSPVIKKSSPPVIDLSATPPEMSSEIPILGKKMSPPQKQVTLAANASLPPLDLLNPIQPANEAGYSPELLQQLSRDVEARLGEFNVEVKVVAVQPGPVITRFELEPAAGVKVSKISGLAKDLARALSVTSVRVVEVIPGKSVIGIEIPNAHREVVQLRAVLEAAVYQRATSPLSMALGHDIGGRPVVVDLAKMPHLLVAGTTGAGKSVGLNAMLLSVLYKALPEQVRMILIDPKMLELSIYEGIPHLLAPVVTDMKEAANALRWCVAEMDRRYRLMAALGVRNLIGYNKKIQDAEAAGEPLTDPFWQGAGSGEAPTALQKLPYIMVLVDEFADMIMVVGKKVEELIARIAQKARAAGIHLILATQRPSVDVITGLIKANVPTRIAFQVSSRIDSRTILDQQGAEQLLGHGDMLYLAPGTGVPTRVHGAYVADEEVHNVVDAWKQLAEPDYLEEILAGGSANATGIPALDEEDGFGDEGRDALYDQAVKIVTETRRASISNVQRRLKIGYNRAARIVEEMEEDGVVGPMESNGSREVLAPPPPPR